MYHKKSDKHGKYIVTREEFLDLTRLDHRIKLKCFSQQKGTALESSEAEVCFLVPDP